MRVYFYTNQEIKENETKEIVNYLRRADIEVISSLTNISDQPLAKVDAFIFRGKKLDTKANYLLALALAQNKQSLCLLPKEAVIDEALEILRNNKSLSKSLHIELCSESEIKDKLSVFLSKLDKETVRDLFDIKYTLRVSSRINDYLNWKSKQENIKKADWIRNKIQAFIKDDQKYQDFLQDKFKAK